MNNSNVILVCGKGRHGKDTTANFLKEELLARGETVLVTHYADALKALCLSSYGWDGNKDEKGRSLLQYIGTETYRANNPDIWINIVKEIIHGCPEKYVIIPDCRFKNEITKLNEFNTTAIKIIRPNFDNGFTEEQKNHSSEIDLDDWNFNIEIYNGGTLDDLKERVKDMVGLRLV